MERYEKPVMTLEEMEEEVLTDAATNNITAATAGSVEPDTVVLRPDPVVTGVK